MPRPRIRGEQWSLNQVRVEADLPRGTIRALVAAGWLAPSGPYSETDIILARLGHWWTRMFPAARHVDTSPVADTARRLAFAAALDPATPLSCVLVATCHTVQAANSLPQALTALPQLDTEAMLVLPIGMWVYALPSRRTAAWHHRAHPDFPTHHDPPANPAETFPPSPVAPNHPASAPVLPPTSDAPTTNPPIPSHMNSPDPEASAHPTGSAFAAYTRARDDLLAAAEARRPATYDSPGEPW